MAFRFPVRFEEALRFLRDKNLMPTARDSRELSMLSAEVRERAFFSATVTEAEILDSALTEVERMVSTTTDRATARLHLRRVIESLGYQPDPAKRGGLQDLTSDRRLNLILDTNVAQAHGYGKHARQQDPAILAAYPCLELYRAGAMPFEPRPWRSKWLAAGGRLYQGRMIARRDDPIWMKPISAGGFNRFGNPYAPFDYNSGMRTRNVSRTVAERLGVMDAGAATPEPDTRRMNEGVEAKPQIASEELKSRLVKLGLGKREADGTITLTISTGSRRAMGGKN